MTPWSLEGYRSLEPRRVPTRSQTEASTHTSLYLSLSIYPPCENPRLQGLLEIKDTHRP